MTYRKEKSGHRDRPTQERRREEIRGEDGHLPAKECWRPSGAGRETSNRFSLTALRRNQPYQHLGLGRLASGTVRQRISVILSHTVCGLYDGGLRRLIHLAGLFFWKWAWKVAVTFLGEIFPNQTIWAIFRLISGGAGIAVKWKELGSGERWHSGHLIAGLGHDHPEQAQGTVPVPAAD